ncbi:MAG: hypothetical protein ABI760_20395 [Ferruginibacter sp.]
MADILPSPIHHSPLAIHDASSKTGCFFMLNSQRCLTLTMKMKFLYAFVWIAVLCSCNGKKVPNTDIEVARAFIKDILENNFKEAEAYVLKEDTNKQYFDLFKKEYESKSREELENYKNADIIINEISPLNDSVSIINFSNSFKKDKSNKVKMVRLNGQWLVDLQYTFSGNL